MIEIEKDVSGCTIGIGNDVPGYRIEIENDVSGYMIKTAEGREWCTRIHVIDIAILVSLGVCCYIASLHSLRAGLSPRLIRGLTVRVQRRQEENSQKLEINEGKAQMTLRCSQEHLKKELELRSRC